MTAPTRDETDRAIAEVSRQHETALGRLAAAFTQTADVARELLDKIDTETDR